MKYIKLRILAVIWVALLLLFSAFFLILYLLLPKHFQKLAEESLQYEMQYIDLLLTEEEVPEYVGSYFSGNISFVPLSDGDQLLESDADTSFAAENQGYLSGLQTAQNEVAEYCRSNVLTYGKCYTLQTQSGFYVLVEYEDVFDLNGPATPAAMYINLQFIFQYTESLCLVLCVFFLCLTAVMSGIGFRLGRSIEQSQETQRHFFQNSSHELKTPLMSIQGYAEGIKNGVMEPVSSAAVILQESDRMTGLVEELLTLSRIDANRMELRPAPTDVREILYDCLRSTEPVWRKKQVTVAPGFSEEPVLAVCDEDKLEQALKNVLVNALRYCRSRVDITCEKRGAAAVIRIGDDGGGIAKADLPHIFDRFYTGEKGSTGIGLALAAEIIHLHQGSIEAQNGERGAVFEIRLPLARK